MHDSLTIISTRIELCLVPEYKSFKIVNTVVVQLSYFPIIDWFPRGTYGDCWCKIFSYKMDRIPFYQTNTVKAPNG